MPVTAQVAAASVAAAPTPMVETLPESALTAATLNVAVGQNARQAVDDAVTRAFGAQRPDCRHTFTPCTDRDAIELVLTARADFAVIGEQLSARELQAGLQRARFGLELFALAVAPGSPVRSLTRAQVRQILTGQVRDWTQLGLAGGAITVVAPADPKLAERATRTLMPGDSLGDMAVRVASDQHVADQILQHASAIGIVRVTEQMPAGMRLLSIDWCAPDAAGFANGTYPFGVPLQVVTAGPAIGNARRFLEFVAGDVPRARLAAQLTLP